MRRIESLVDTNAADYKANYAAMSVRLKEFLTKHFKYLGKTCLHARC